ncbi:MAG: chemotaxis protein CheX [Spirochaetia bacterium]|nr:chemotaxis protein CheX [Spirochaetia bacterium]
MDPLLDEKIVLTLARSFSEHMKASLYVSAEKEAYGPSRNEGLCFESCSAIGFNGQIHGTIYLCMDGYTKMKLLPRIADRFQIDPGQKGMADSVLLEFSNQIASVILNELRDGGYDLELEPPESLNHKMVPIDLNQYREYILIFFLRDRRLKLYLGRATLVLVLKKF